MICLLVSALRLSAPPESKLVLDLEYPRVTLNIVLDTALLGMDLLTVLICTRICLQRENGVVASRFHSDLALTFTTHASMDTQFCCSI